ncbi:50S ribosomal protein L34e [Candidatus Bathyarchaeota archaeon]|nr:50S ribosomal protein L34e [Candidatus Bathyarchaeota archaeon]NIU81621.1 50S ribosomal protein L34e [Candidatus Bathyarchaeota archaeon]NIV68266.1 50S ribosomal protein L34e [Candidatus Bathyarchaeota archaeon]NIW16607.1 50S ribosomal protein L34e [Candidatus Bathyarchaeota archaeon]NIW34807.1 50S ribosomal protein L34e [Candidatus Bathyarchaeota archaeon]
MPEPSERTRSRKRQDLRVPGGDSETHLKRERPSALCCSRCGGELHGIPRLVPVKLLKLSASQRSTERMYGGQLCHDCLRRLLKQAVRSSYRP